jgi:hypothetical protein
MDLDPDPDPQHWLFREILEISGFFIYSGALTNLMQSRP